MAAADKENEPLGRPLLLLEAAYAYRANGEDRLTELLASALVSHPGFCRELHEALNLPGGERYLIATQHRVSPECRLDMRIEARTVDGATASVIYSEHKLDGYWFSDGQIARERAGLEAERANAKRLICVISADELATLRAADPDVPTGTTTVKDFDNPFTWSEIARLARQAGRGWPAPWGGSGWADRALEPDAPAAQRVLVEFLTYLEEDEVPEAISADDLLAFRIADQAEEKVESLLTLATQHVEAFQLSDDKDVVYDDESSAGVPLTCVNFDLPSGHWLATDEDSFLSAAIATTNAATPWGEEEPHVYAGVYIAAEEHAAAARGDRAWMAASVARNLEALAYEPGLWMVGTRLLSDFTAAPATLETQAAALGQWLDEILIISAGLGPPQRHADGSTGPRRQQRPRKTR